MNVKFASKFLILNFLVLVVNISFLFFAHFSHFLLISKMQNQQVPLSGFFMIFPDFSDLDKSGIMGIKLVADN